MGSRVENRGFKQVISPRHDRSVMFMAKDGTSRGGARPGSGQKKKPIADKILDGNPGHRRLTIMEFTDTADLAGERMPEPRDYL